MKLSASILLALLLGGIAGLAASLDEQIVSAINAGDTTSLLSLLTPEARPTEMEAQVFIEQVHTLFGTLTATGKGRDMSGVHSAAVLGREFTGMTLQITDDVKSSKSSDTGLRLVYATDAKSGWQANTNALWQIKVEGIASAADLDQWLQGTKHETLYSPAHVTHRKRKISSGPEVDKDGNIILTKYVESDEHTTNTFVFSISKARFDAQPAWEPVKQPVPLGIDGALKIAQDWVRKQPWADGSEHLNYISLENNNDRWFYYIGPLIQNRGNASPTAILVLLDGSVVEPKAVKEGDAVTGSKSGIKIVSETPGIGAEIKKGDRVRVRYDIQLNRGDYLAKDQEAVLTMGDREMVPGFRYGLEGMRAGGLRRFRASPHLCYRDQELERIPQNAVVIFDIKSVEILA